MAQFIKPKSLSVVVPVRNEEDNVADLIFEIRKSLKNKINYFSFPYFFKIDKYFMKICHDSKTLCH